MNGRAIAPNSIVLSRFRTSVPRANCTAATFRALYYELSQLESDLHRHIHLENYTLFPRAVELEG
jgi:regulator of cell morphogenesis and NO signaling